MTDFIIIGIVLIIIALALAYIIRAKKNGAKCVGCPHSKTCSAGMKNNSSCSCGDEKN